MNPFTFKRAALATVAAAATLGVALPGGVATAGATELPAADTTELIAPGIVLHHLIYLQSATTYLDAQALVINTNQTGDHIGLMTPSVGTVSSSGQPMSQQAAAAGAIAGVNGDFFDINDSTAAIGPEVLGDTPGTAGTILKSADPGLSTSSEDWQTLAQTTSGTLEQNATLNFTATATVTPASGSPTTLTVNGLNQAPGSNNGVAGSSVNNIIAFTPVWGTYSRASTVAGATSTTEVLVTNNKVVSVDSGSGTSAAEETTPSGTIPANSFVLLGREAGATSLAQLTVGESVSLNYSLTTPTGEPLQWAIGTYQPILTKGAADPTNLDDASGYPRTAVGYSQDGKTIVMLAVDGKRTTFPGATAAELQSIMLSFGMYDAVTFDEGGSTDLVARPADSSTITVRNQPSDGDERSDANGIGVFAPTSTGVPSAFLISPTLTNPDNDGATLESSPDSDNGATVKVFAGGHAQFSATPVDPSWGPITTRSGAPSWSTSAGTVDATGLLSVPNTPGATINLTTTATGMSGTLAVQVLGTVQSLSASADSLSFTSASSTSQELDLTGRDAQGWEAPLDGADVTSSYDHSIISVARAGDGGLRITPVATGTTTLKLTAGSGEVDVTVTVGGTATAPATEPVAVDPDVASVGNTATPSGSTGIGIAADPEITGSGDSGAIQLTAAIQRARAAGDGLFIVDGGITASGTSAQITAAANTLTAAGCAIVTTTPSATTTASGQIPCLVVPGDTDAAAVSAGTFASSFGADYKEFIQNGTEYLLLDSSSGSLRGSSFAQLTDLENAVADIPTDASVNRLVVLESRPAVNAPNTTGTALTNTMDAAALRRALSTIAQSGKQVVLMTSDGRSASVTRDDGVIDDSLAPLTGTASATPVTGGFDGSQQLTLAANDQSFDIEPAASAVALSLPQTLTQGTAGTATGTLTLANGASLSAGFPDSPQWVAGNGMAIGSGAAAISAAQSAGDIAILDPATGQLTGLNPGTATLQLLANSVSGASTPLQSTAQVTVIAAPSSGGGSETGTGTPTGSGTPTGGNSGSSAAGSTTSGAGAGATTTPVTPITAVTTPTATSTAPAKTTSPTKSATPATTKLVVTAAKAAYRSGVIGFALKLPAKGKVAITATIPNGRKKTLKIGSAAATLAKARTLSVKLKTTAVFRTKLSRSAETVTITITYTASTKRKVTLRETLRLKRQTAR